MTYIKDDVIHLPWSNPADVEVPDADQLAIFAGAQGQLMQMDAAGNLKSLDNSWYYPMGNFEVTGSDVSSIAIDISNYYFDVVQMVLLVRNSQADWESDLAIYINDLAPTASTGVLTHVAGVAGYEDDLLAINTQNQHIWLIQHWIYGDNATAGLFAPMLFTFFNVANNTHPVSMMWQSMNQLGNGNGRTVFGGGHYYTSERVEKINLASWTPGTYDLKVGTRGWLWGIR